MANTRYPKYQIRNNELYHAGEILRSDEADYAEWINAYTLLGKWRTMHAYPMNTFQAAIRNILKRLGLDEKAIVAQRLKRLSSIIFKLSRFDTMRLERMQDIGGLRIILPKIEDVYRVRQALKESKWKHKECGGKDYIATPASSGYRSVHLIFRYNNKLAPKEYQGLRVEIQIRTQLQHVWATTVETIGTFIEHHLKSSQGPKKWLDYLKLASAVFAMEEGTPIPDEYALYPAKQLVTMLHTKTIQLNAFAMLDAFHKTVQFDATRGFKNKFILLKLDFDRNTSSAIPFNQKDLEAASFQYEEIEKERNKNQDAVLVSSRSLKELLRAYPNYFIDASEFIKHLSKLFKKFGLPDVVIPPSVTPKQKL